MNKIRLSLVSLVIAVLAGTAHSVPAKGNEVPGMRTEYSRTFLQADGRYTTRIYTTPVNQRSRAGGWDPVDTDSVRNCYPQNVPNWTGNVLWQNSNYTKNSGDLYFRGGRNSSQDKRQAWAKFDLSTIPDGATITTGYFYYYCYQIGDMPTTSVTLVTSDPVSASASTLWTEITTGTLVSPDYGHGEGWQTRELNNAGVTAIQSGLTSDWIALGVHEAENNNKAWGYAYGFGGGPGAQYKPYLSVTYSPPPVTDVSAEDVIAPSGTMEPGPVIPMGRWRNNQPHADNFTAYFFLAKPNGTRVYRESLTVASIPGMQDTTLLFPTTDVGPDTGTWTARCSTYAANDINTSNDAVTEGFRVVVYVPGFDVAALEIVDPTHGVDTNTTVVPRARWRNNSGSAVDFVGYFFMENPSKARTYARNVAVLGLAAGADTVLSFPGHNVGLDTGQWAVRCSTFAVNDTDPANDAQSGTFTVYADPPPWPFGWHEARSVPAMQSGRDVKDGGWLAEDPSTQTIYGAKGNNTGDFYSYDPVADTWKLLASWREGREAKMSKKGGVGAADGAGHVYAVKGSNTLGFWRYDITGDSWVQLSDVLLGGSRKRVKGGSDLACVNLEDGAYVYLLKGYKNDFYRFSLAKDSWEAMPEAPSGGSLKWDKGSWLVYDGDHTLYAHKAKRHELWSFNLATQTWGDKQLNGMPFASRQGKTKKSKDGGSAAYYDGCIYALKGGNTCEFWRYDVLKDSWTELDTIPQYGSTGRKKRVKAGGDIVACGDGRFYALKGGKTREFWRYFLLPPTDAGGAAGSITPVVSLPRLSIQPNPARGRTAICYALPGIAPARLDVFNAAGQLVISRTTAGARDGLVRLDGLHTGAYLVQLTVGNRTLTGKLVVER